MPASAPYCSSAAEVGCRGLAGLGLISYEIFLLHQPFIRDYNHHVWQRILSHAPNEWQLATGAALALLITLPLVLPVVQKLAVTMMPQFLIFRSLGWYDSLRPLWVPAFFGSALAWRTTPRM